MSDFTANQITRKMKFLDGEIAKINLKKEDIIQTLKELQINEKSGKKLVIKLASIQNKVERAAEEYKNNIEKVKTRVGAINTYYETIYIPLINKIEGDSGEVEKVISNAKELQKQLDDEKNFVMSLKSQVNNEMEAYRTNTTSIATLKDEAEKLKEAIESDKVQVDSDKKTAASRVNRIKFLTDNFNEKKEELDRLLTQISTLKDDINSLSDEARITNDKISHYYEIATNKTMAGAFDNQKKILVDDLRVWHQYLIWTTLGLLALVITVFVFQIGLNDWNLNNLSYDFYLRFILATPIIYYLFFCAKQYGNTRALLEKYSYKTAIALSIEAHTELLHSTFGKDIKYQEKVLEFTLSSLNKIYDEPFFDDKNRALLRNELMKAKSQIKTSQSNRKKNEVIDIAKTVFTAAKNMK